MFINHESELITKRKPKSEEKNIEIIARPKYIDKYNALGEEIDEIVTENNARSVYARSDTKIRKKCENSSNERSGAKKDISLSAESAQRREQRNDLEFERENK